MIVSRSDWTDYNDVIKHHESNYYCMISNGCFINIPKPSNVDKEYGDDCVNVKLTNDNKPYIYIYINKSICIIIDNLCKYEDYLTITLYFCI